MYPESVCSQPCAPGNATVYAVGANAECCWVCVSCLGKYQFVNKTKDSDSGIYRGAPEGTSGTSWDVPVVGL